MKKLSLSQLLALRILTKDFPTTSVGFLAEKGLSEGYPNSKPVCKTIGPTGRQNVGFPEPNQSNETNPTKPKRIREGQRLCAFAQPSQPRNSQGPWSLPCRALFGAVAWQSQAQKPCLLSEKPEAAAVVRLFARGFLLLPLSVTKPPLTPQSRPKTTWFHHLILVLPRPTALLRLLKPGCL